MATAPLKKQLSELRASMLEEGLVDMQFERLLLAGYNPDLVMEKFTLFCDDFEDRLRDIDYLMDEVDVDYSKIYLYLHQMIGSTASLGVPNLRSIITQFQQICYEGHEDGCMKAQNALKNEYLYLRGKLETMFQLEQKIKLYEAKFSQ